jgi:diaminopimelate epimerase
VTAPLATAGPADPRPAAALPIAKYEGAGNDFVVLDGRPPAPGAGLDWGGLARRLCDRHFGVGADGLLVAAPSEGARLRMRMFNPDGSEAELCGNGLRCFVRWLVQRGEAGPGRLVVETEAGPLEAVVEADGRIGAEMGAPRLRPAEIPLSAAAAAGQPPEGPVLRLPLGLADLPAPPEGYAATCVSMGNPHAVLFVPDAAAVPLEAVGPRLEHHPAFPARTNVEVCQVLARDRLRVRVWERGAGITLACGTGACAAAVAARLWRYVDARVVVELLGGELEVTWPGDPRRPVFLRGPAVHVFDGVWPGARP